jgi:hypothetical protein
VVVLFGGRERSLNCGCVGVAVSVLTAGSSGGSGGGSAGSDGIGGAAG